MQHQGIGVGFGTAGPAFTGIAEGFAAGKVAFDIIERKALVPIDDPEAKDITLNGHIQFKDVTFYYPTRPD